MHALRSKIWEEGFRGTTQTGLTDAEGEEIAHRLHAQNTAREEDRSAAPCQHRFSRLLDRDQGAGDIYLNICSDRLQALLLEGLCPDDSGVVVDDLKFWRVAAHQLGHLKTVGAIHRCNLDPGVGPSPEILRQYFLDRAGSEHDPKTFRREAACCAESNPGPRA